MRARAAARPEYLTALRIDTANCLLPRDPPPTAIDVATAVGFDSLPSFSRRFRSTVGIPPARRHLADEVGYRPLQLFSLLPCKGPAVRVHLELPEGFSAAGDPSVRVGWYPHPVPIGLPKAGVLVTGRQSLRLPLADGASRLLGFAVAAGADAMDQLIPATPMVAAHSASITQASDTALTVRFVAGTPTGIPLLSALPSLCRD